MSSFFVSVVIPNFNGEKILEKNLKALHAVLLHAEVDRIEIIISDDHSTDKSEEIITAFIKSHHTASLPILCFQNSGPQGFSCNVNSAVQHAKGDIILLLNTDVVPEKGFLEPLLRHFSNPKLFAVGAAEKTTDSGKEVIFGRSIGRFARGFIVHKAGQSNEKKTFWVSCGSGVFRKDIWDLLHGLDGIYNPFYWEDIDLSYRAVKSGYTILFEPESIVQHNHESGAIKSHFTAQKVKRTAYRNQFIFVWKNITDANFVLQHICWLPYHFLKALMRGDTAFFSGFWSAILLTPNIIQSKMNAKKRFILSDRDVLKKQQI